MKNIQSRINQAMAEGNIQEASILVDVRESLPFEQKKTIRRSVEQIEADIRKVYAGDNPYLAGPVQVVRLWVD